MHTIYLMHVTCLKISSYFNLVITGPDLTDSDEVHCGGHTASTCDFCPQGKGASWCHGECFWHNNKCQKRAGKKQTCRALVKILKVPVWVTLGSTRWGHFREVVDFSKRCIFLYILNEKIFSGPFRDVHISDFFKTPFQQCFEEIAYTNISERSRKFFFIKNI